MQEYLFNDTVTVQGTKLTKNINQLQLMNNMTGWSVSGEVYTNMLMPK